MQIAKSADGTRIAFDRTGKGPPVVLIGGAFSYRRFKKMVELAELLAPRFTVVNYDRRGRGDSEDRAPYSVEREIEDLAAATAEVSGSASLWGWSSGGALALRAAASGLDVSRIAIYEAPFTVEKHDRLPPPDFAERLQALVDADRRTDAVRYYMTKGMGAPGPFVTMMRLTPFWSKLKETAPTLPYDWAVLGDTMAGEPLDPEEWSAVRAPTLVVAGEKSPEQLRKGAAALAGTLPAARLRMLEGQSHNPKMKALAPVLAEFFGAGSAAEGREIASDLRRRLL